MQFQLCVCFSYTSISYYTFLFYIHLQLKGKLKEIEDSLAERELKIMSDNLRVEYDRQLTNIRNLRALYEERARVNAAERENLIRQLDTKRTELDAEIEK